MLEPSTEVLLSQHLAILSFAVGIQEMVSKSSAFKIAFLVNAKTA